MTPCPATPGCIASWCTAGGTGAGECAAARPALDRPPACVPGTPPRHRGACAHHRVAVNAASGGLLAVGAYIARPPGHGDYFGAAVAVNCKGANCHGQIQVPRHVRDAPVPLSPVQRAPISLTPHSGYTAGRTLAGPQDASPGAPRRPIYLRHMA